MKESKMKKVNKSRRDFLSIAGAGLAASALAPSVALGATKKGAQGKNQHQQLKGKVALVTGGARGIGKACALDFAAKGANVVLYDIASQIKGLPYKLATEQDLANTKKEVEALGVKCLAVKGDVRDDKKQKNTVARAIKEFGSLDIAVANAGITQLGAIEKFSEEEVQLVLDINLAGAIKTVQAVIPQMKKQKSGRIVLMASVTGRAGNKEFPIYSTSKWGMIGFTKSTALSVGKSNITCNAVCPSLVDTKLLNNPYVLKGLFPKNPTMETFHSVAKNGVHVIPVGLYEPEEVAHAVSFLCSEDAKYISGEIIDINAGVSGQNSA